MSRESRFGFTAGQLRAGALVVAALLVIALIRGFA